jgi:hypothetical protein
LKHFSLAGLIENMPENSPSNDEELINDLSELEQENIVAGQSINIPGLGTADFFFQNTNIQTDANSHLNLGGSDSSSQNTRYNLSQITLATSVKFILPSLDKNGFQSNKFLLNLWTRIFS